MLEHRPEPPADLGEVRVRVEACAVCRTDLHVVDGDLASCCPVIPGHEIDGILDTVGEGVTAPAAGQRIGIPWLGHACGTCTFCIAGDENLCDRPGFTGYTRDGGFASHVLADVAFTLQLDSFDDPVATAPCRAPA